MEKYRMRLLLDEMPVGGVDLLAKKLKIDGSAVTHFLRRKKAGFSSMDRYTKAFNKVFNTNHTREYLFEKIEEEGNTK